MDSSLYAKIKESGRYCRDIRTRKKIVLFLDVIRLGNVRSACLRHGVIPKTYYFWWKRFVRGRFRLESLQCHSRRPKHSPRKIKGKALKLICYYRREFHYGPERIQMYLRLNHDMMIARSTIGEVIRREKLILRRNRKQKKNHHTRRYSLAWPGEGLQMDIKYVPYKIQGEQYYVYSAIDDCSRWRMSRLYKKKGILQAVDFLTWLAQLAPFSIKRLQLDNDAAFTNRLSPSCLGQKHDFEEKAKALGIHLRFIPPGEKELQGKIERLHRTDDDEFFWKAPRDAFETLKEKLGHWVFEYNHFRHHKELEWKTPHQVLEEKYLEQCKTMPYISSKPPGLSPAITIEQKRYKRTQWMEKYLGYLNWKDSNPLPVTHVPGYYKEPDTS